MRFSTNIRNAFSSRFHRNSAVALSALRRGALPCPARRRANFLAIAAILMVLGSVNVKVNAEVPCARAAKSSGERLDDVSKDVEVSLGGVRLDRQTGHFVGLATLTNRSGTEIKGPISVVFTTGGRLRLLQAEGTTCAVAPFGRSYAQTPVEGNVLGAGATVQMRVEFANPDREPIHAATQVLAGNGAR